jgi:hypothetical protein
MSKNRHKRLSLFSALLLVFMPVSAYAQSSSSPNYRVDQTIFSSGSQLDDCDTTALQYCAQMTAGDLTVGQTSGTAYRAFAGFNTTDEPFLEFVVTASDIDLGYLDTSAASTATGTFYVRAWQASGYAVRTASDPPTNTAGSNHQITPLAAPTASSPGTEQFGINLKDNSAPNVGAEALQVPDNTFSFGTAATGYDTADSFKYVKGDVVAQSAQSSSVTIYTISYLFNISDVTPAGQYNFNHVLVATGTY